MTYTKRELHELVDEDEPGWPIVESWIEEAKQKVELLAPPQDPADTLVSVQVTTLSPMGAIIFNTGGILVDSGWLRILGSGHPRLPRALSSWNFACGLPAADTPPSWLLIADDVLGGFFALNGGRFAPEGNNIWYFAPDTLEWEDTELGYSGFVYWCFTGDVPGFYETRRWAGWEAEVAELGGDEGLHFYPLLCAEGPPIGERMRTRVPIEELFSVHVGTV